MHLVIGAAGFAGRQAVAALGEHVRVRGAEPGDDLAAAMAGVEVVHLAVPVRSPFERLRRSRRHRPHPFLAHALELARSAGVRRVVHLSSAHVFGFPKDGRVSERRRPQPEHPYERLLAGDDEWLRQQYDPDVVVIRPAQPFGPGEPVLACLLDQLTRGRVLLPAGGWARRTFLAGADLGRAFLAAGLRGEPGAAYLFGGFEGSWCELLEAAAAALSIRPRLNWRSYNLAYLGAVARLPGGEPCWPTPFMVDLMARRGVVEDGWTRRELSWEPLVQTFADGLGDLAGWFRGTAAAVLSPLPKPGTAAFPPALHGP